VRVLVVSEDVKERLRAVSALRLHAAAEVVEASTADEARDLLLVDRPGFREFDVLVVDGDLRPRGGFAVLYDLRGRADLGGAQAVPSLVMTSREQDAWLAGWAGANDVLLKPVDSFALARRVGELEGAELLPYGDAGSAAAQLEAALRDPA
jgi:DNA-binding response OmpR family regulator